jgi:hypothetical protein
VFSTLLFSIVGTLILGLSAVGLVYLMAFVGGGQRVRSVGGGRTERGPSSSPVRSATQRARKS